MRITYDLLQNIKYKPMKKYFFKITAVILLVGLITSCDEKQVIYDGDPVVALFASDFSQLNVLEQTNGSALIAVNVSSLSSADRKIVVSVNPEGTTATPNQYSIDQASLVIPANSYTGFVKVSSTYESLPADGSVSLVINLVEVGDPSLHLDTVKTTYTLRIKRSCPFELSSIGVNFTGTPSIEEDVYNSFVPVMVQNPDKPNEFDLNTLWGLNFIGDFTGSSSLNGLYVYKGKIIINDDLTLTVVGTDPGMPGGSGVYDPCTNTFSYTLAQDLFLDTFVVNVVLTPN